MKLPKLSPKQWFQLVLSLLPLLRGLVRVAGLGVVSVIRSLIEIVAKVESLFPADPSAIDPATGKPRKRGAEKLAAFRELVVAAFATADESGEVIESELGDLGQIAAVIVGLFNEWKLNKE